MFESWFNLLHLTTEAQQVIGLRMLKIGSGGADAHAEAYLMVSEKLEAGTNAFFALMTGATSDTIVDGYRREVQANVRRLASQG